MHKPIRSSRKINKPNPTKMQITNPPDAGKFPAIEAAIQKERLQRYLPAAGGDAEEAFRYYLWNCNLCESFYLPLQFAEVLTRNAVHRCLIARLGEEWYLHTTFRRLLDGQFERELQRAIDDETAQHQGNLTNHHICSALTFGFWEHLTIKRFSRLLWSRGLHHSFPNIGTNTREDLHELIEKVRRWRNRIAHHRAIFDKGPSKKFQETMDLITLVCSDTADWTTSVSNVQQTISMRPESNGIT
ncbi:hypothetical protein [Hwanghaeella sp.]|uniref:hypothetical protein n=1 Tax=Hwanghaeella sp. TaxID=2605943 RepID=UPI003CCBD5DC